MKMEYDTKMISSIAHSTRNPIMIIGGFARTLQKKIENNKNDANDISKEFVDSINAEAHQLEGVLDELFTYAQQIEMSRIVRTIEFQPQHYQAGLSILTYFNTIVSQKYPKNDVNVKIEQSGNSVKLTIETPDGNKEEIEKTLDQYGQVLKGEIPPEDLCLNPFEVMSLKNKLEIAALELRHAEQLHRICEQKNTERITALEFNVTQLQDIVANGIKSSINSVDALSNIVNKYAYDTKIKSDIENLIVKLNTGIASSDEQEIKQILSNIQLSEPHLLSELKDFALNSLAGVSGNFLYAWITALLAGR